MEEVLNDNKTVEHDIADYLSLIDECTKLSIEYATAIKYGISQEDYDAYILKYNDIFERETKIKESISLDTFYKVIRDSNPVCEGILALMKFNAETNTEDFLAEVKQSNKTRK